MKKEDTISISFTEEQTKEIIRNSFKNDGYFKLNICLFNYLNKDFEATALLTELINKEEYFIRTGKIEKDSDFYLTQTNIEQRLGLTPFRQNQALNLLKSKKLVSVERKGLPARNFYKLNNDLILMVLSISTKDHLKQGQEGVKHIYNNINNNNINNNSSNNKLLEEKKDFDKSSSSHPLKTRNKISLQKESIRNSYSKESLAPPSKVIKEPIITEDVKLIMDYWMECKLHMPKKETKSYINSINSIKNLLSGKTFGVKYTIEEIKQSIDNFANSAYNPECEPLSIDKKKKLQSLPIGDFIRSYQGYSYFEDYLKKSPKTLIEDKFPEITKSLKKIYSEEVFGTVNKTYETDQENIFRKASKKLKQFIGENITRWNDYMVPKTDYDEAMLLWASIKYDFMGSDNFSCVTPNWLISNKTFEHRLPAFLFHQGYLTDESDKSKTSTFSDRSKIYSDSKSDCEYWQALLYD